MSKHSVAIGPTWTKGENGEYVLPTQTLGWEILVWCNRNLLLPDGRPWEHTPEQARFLLWWYALDDAGRFLYRNGVLQRLKGWGKDPLAATIAAAEFVGPCRFSHWENGAPVAQDNPQAWVVVAGVSKDSTRTTMTVFPWLFQQHTIDEYGIDIGKEIIYAERGARRIEAVTSSPRALEGGRSTFTIAGETQHWLATNDGWEMAAVIERNAAKSPDGSSRTLAITNAYEPGEESVAEATRDSWENVQVGRAVDVGLLYDSLEAAPSVTLDPEILPAVLQEIRGDSTWLDIPRIVQEIMDSRNPPSRSRRFWLNQIVATEDAWVTPQEWDVLADRQVRVDKGELVALGFAGPLTDDHSALMGCRISDGYLFTLGVWDPAKTGGEAPRAAIDRAVRAAFEHYDVVAFFSDLHPWESYVDRWMLELGGKLCAFASSRHKVAWDMRARQKEFTLEGAERTHNEITEQALKHDGDARVRQHVHNARRRPNAWGVSFGKEHRESSRKVDSLAALILARMARRTYLALPKQKQRRKRQKAVFF
jgi:hypothetical protein